MNKLHIHILSIFSFICLSCQQQTPQNQIEQAAVDFCEAFYNFTSPVAEEWRTPSSLSYLSFLASNIQQKHIEQLKAQGAAKISVVSSEIDANSERATVVCEIKNAHIISPISGEMQQISVLRDTLELMRERNKWLIRMDIPRQNGKRNHD